MQIYFPNFKTKQGAIVMFDYLMASRDSSKGNVIFNSDLNLEDQANLPGGNQPLVQDAHNDPELYSFLGFVIENFENHNAQVFQDLYVLWKLNNKSGGTFVEVGTAYPSGSNNTWLLESKLKWSGVLVEPNPYFHGAILQTRKMPLEMNAIHRHTGEELILYIPNDFQPGGAVKDQRENRHGIDVRREDEISVKTISMLDCLEKYKVPKNFDYLSYDTTGNIADIENLESMLANKYIPKVITVGHNYKSHRHALHNMLQSHGYKREFDYLSRWDDWYYI